MTHHVPIPDHCLDQIFHDARTHSAFQDKEVPDDLLKQVYNLMKWGPTSANCCPLRIVFVRSEEAREKLKPCLDAGNVEKTMKAPVCAILAYDIKFYEELPRLFPHTDARSWFAGNDKKIQDTAFRNSSLQGAYFIIAARTLGLDCGPMSGFDEEKLNQAFFPDGQYKANFICNLGYGDASKLHPRNPRLEFEEAAKIV